MAAALAPASSLRFKSYSAACLFSVYTRNISTNSRTPAIRCHFASLPRRYPEPSSFSGSAPTVSDPKRNSFCTVITGALSSGEAVEKPKPDVLTKIESETGKKVGEFRKRLRIVDIKGGADEGVDRLGQTLVVKGWVRTLREQSSITFIEVTIALHFD